MGRRRHIQSQGDLDGACFLYSVANAAIALTGRRPDRLRWSKAMRQIPHPADFLDPECGTTLHYEQDPTLLDRALEQMLDILYPTDEEPRIDFTWHPEAAGFADVAELIDEQSVAIFRYGGDTRYARDLDHWVCGVSARPAAGEKPLRIYAACSSRWVDAYPEGSFPYSERRHRNGRWSNDVVIDDGRAELVNGCVVQLRLAPVRRTLQPAAPRRSLRLPVLARGRIRSAESGRDSFTGPLAKAPTPRRD